ncbi:response regulator transcription factor [Microbacterium sp. 13-71-7]|jgi:two-component system response regulator QseB|uniref:response regulator transcription factor n=1 Tax=Microbacterium sp. 13-71-7 TaxID=1970399 RepID=UPI000BD6BFD1|nr:response regulator transcription factor [Microbacterium sp. 13-71-7]OZB81115.1 MAG: two-component system response regulator [Microbacterium sp. 13-71-7]
MNGRLLIVEDDPRLGPIMREVLGTEWDVELCGTAELGLAAVLSTAYDVLIVDRRLPGINGEELVRALRRGRVATPILMLTALGELRDRVEGLDAGANDYLVKPFEFEELSARLRALTRDYGDRGEGIGIGSWRFHPDDQFIESPYTGRILLTEAETAFLQVLAAEPERTFSREYLLQAVLTRSESQGTVDAYVHYLRRKTDRDLIHTIRGSGYRLGTPA